MRCVIVASLLALWALPIISTADPAPALNIDAAKSRASFTVSHILLGRVSGTIPIVAGTIAVAADGAPVSASATLDPARIDTGDSDRDGDLQSGAWFDTGAFPRINFVSTQISRSADGGYAIAGDLTIRGVTRNVTLTCRLLGAQPGPDGPSYHFAANTQIDRRDFMPGERWTDPLVGHSVAIDLDIWTSAAPKPPKP